MREQGCGGRSGRTTAEQLPRGAALAELRGHQAGRARADRSPRPVRGPGPAPSPGPPSTAAG